MRHAGFGLLIFDEEHHLPGKCRREAAIFSAATMRLGLTATPERSDGLHKVLGVTWKNHRMGTHTPQFTEMERGFRQYREAKAVLKKLAYER